MTNVGIALDIIIEEMEEGSVVENTVSRVESGRGHTSHRSGDGGLVSAADGRLVRKSSFNTDRSAPEEEFRRPSRRDSNQSQRESSNESTEAAADAGGGTGENSIILVDDVQPSATFIPSFDDRSSIVASARRAQAPLVPTLGSSGREEAAATVKDAM